MRQTKDQTLLKVQTAQHLASEDPEQAELLLRSALRDAEALGHSSPALHLQLAELLQRLRRTRQALEQVIEVLRLDPFNLVALNLRRMLGRGLRRGGDASGAEDEPGGCSQQGAWEPGPDARRGMKER